MSFDGFFFSFRETGILSTRKFMLLNANNQKGLLSNRASSIFNVLEIVPKQQELICSDLLVTNLQCRWIGRLSCKDGVVTTVEMFWAQPKNLQSYSIISNCNKENMNWSLRKWNRWEIQEGGAEENSLWVGKMHVGLLYFIFLLAGITIFNRNREKKW